MNPIRGYMLVKHYHAKRRQKLIMYHILINVRMPRASYL